MPLIAYSEVKTITNRSISRNEKSQATFTILPVKILSEAKSRLSPLLSKNERIQFSLKMLEDVLLASESTKRVHKTIVVSKDPQVLPIASRFQIPIFRESQSGLNQSITEALDYCISNAAETVLILPADIPSVLPEDVEKILVFGRAASVVICPSREGSGTNALLLNPPRVVPSFYGKNSFRRYIEEASRRGIRVHVYESPRIALDIDTVQDVVDFVASKADRTRAYRFLMEINVLERLEHRRQQW